MRRLLVALSCPWVFRSSRSSARQLRDLARTEQGSFLTLQWAAQRTPSVERQALYLRHASDEARHARLFWGRADEFEAAASPLIADGEDLFALLGEEKFLAFVHHAERRGREQFEIYRDYFLERGATDDAEMLRGICHDEGHHQSYSLKLLTELVGSEADARRHLRNVRLWESVRLWKRSGAALSSGLYTLAIWALFPLLLPYALLARLSRPSVGWRSASPKSESLPPRATPNDG